MMHIFWYTTNLDALMAIHLKFWQTSLDNHVKDLQILHSISWACLDLVAVDNAAIKVFVLQSVSVDVGGTDGLFRKIAI